MIYWCERHDDRGLHRFDYLLISHFLLNLQDFTSVVSNAADCDPSWTSREGWTRGSSIGPSTFPISEWMLVQSVWIEVYFPNNSPPLTVLHPLQRALYFDHVASPYEAEIIVWEERSVFVDDQIITHSLISVSIFRLRTRLLHCTYTILQFRPLWFRSRNAWSGKGVKGMRTLEEESDKRTK